MELLDELEWMVIRERQKGVGDLGTDALLADLRKRYERLIAMRAPPDAIAAVAAALTALSESRGPHLVQALTDLTDTCLREGMSKDAPALRRALNAIGER